MWEYVVSYVIPDVILVDELVVESCVLFSFVRCESVDERSNDDEG